jgi:hypothetical protein
MTRTQAITAAIMAAALSLAIGQARADVISHYIVTGATFSGMNCSPGVCGGNTDTVSWTYDLTTNHVTQATINGAPATAFIQGTQINNIASAQIYAPGVYNFPLRLVFNDLTGQLTSATTETSIFGPIFSLINTGTAGVPAAGSTPPPIGYHYTATGAIFGGPGCSPGACGGNTDTLSWTFTVATNTVDSAEINGSTASIIIQHGLSNGLVTAQIYAPGVYNFPLNLVFDEVTGALAPATTETSIFGPTFPLVNPGIDTAVPIFAPSAVAAPEPNSAAIVWVGLLAIGLVTRHPARPNAWKTTGRR